MSLQDVADPDGPSEDARTMVWVRRGLIGALTFILLLVLFALMGSHSATVRQQASAERLQTSMSQLSTWTGKAKTTIKQADRIGLKDTDDIDSLRRLIDSNGRLMRSDRTGLSENESERLAAKRQGHETHPHADQQDWPARQGKAVDGREEQMPYGIGQGVESLQ